MASNDLRSKSLDELRELEAALAKQRTEVRLEQNAVAEEIGIREGIAQMPKAAQDALLKRITVGGRAGLEGDMGSASDEAEEDNE